MDEGYLPSWLEKIEPIYNSYVDAYKSPMFYLIYSIWYGIFQK
jgi:hypothetical protein